MRKSRGNLFVRQDVIRNLLFRPTFFSRKDLEIHLKDLIQLFDTEDEHLERTGISTMSYEHWYGPFSNLVNLYFTKIPFASAGGSNVPAAIWKESLQQKDPSIARNYINKIRATGGTDYVWMKYQPSRFEELDSVTNKQLSSLKKIEVPYAKVMLNFGKYGYWDDGGRLYDIHGRDVRQVSFMSAKRFEWIGGELARKIDLIRPKLLAAKVRTLTYLLECVRGGERQLNDKQLDDLLENLAASLFEEIGSDDLEICSKLEHAYLENRITNYGGVIPLIGVICRFVASANQYSEIAHKLSKFRIEHIASSGKVSQADSGYPSYRYREISDSILKEVKAAYDHSIAEQVKAYFFASEKINNLIENHLKIRSHKKSKHGKPRVKIKKLRTFQWSKVRIGVEDATHIFVVYEGAKYTLSYEDIGLLDRKSGGPNHAWLILAKLIHENGVVETRSKEKSLPQMMMKIRGALKGIFGTTANPFDKNVSFKAAHIAKFSTNRISDEFLMGLQNESFEPTHWDLLKSEDIPLEE